MWDKGNTPNAQKRLKPRYIKKLVTTRATQSDFRRRGFSRQNDVKASRYIDLSFFPGYFLSQSQ